LNFIVVRWNLIMVHQFIKLNFVTTHYKSIVVRWNERFFSSSKFYCSSKNKSFVEHVWKIFEVWIILLLDVVKVLL
jgi:hypothetical protein